MSGGFVLEGSDGAARCGVLQLKHGQVQTPVFMPVGTQACIKTLDGYDLERLDAAIVLANSYHLSLHNAPELIAKAGGLHRFMSWSRPILTDSGGFQVFSLNALARLSEKGVMFRSHINGDKLFFSPESVVELQELFGSDIHMMFDECAPAGVSYGEAKQAMQRSLRWAKRCRVARKRDDLAQFSIVQGGVWPDLRKQSIEELISLDSEGMAIGGLSVGENRSITRDITALCCEHLPIHKPRYLMGVGTPLDIMDSISYGVDMFDCVMPTRNGRNGLAFSWQGKVNIRNARYKFDEAPLDKDCSCAVCKRYSKAYIRYLFTAKEITASRLLSYHNLHFYLSLARKAREAIQAGEFAKLHQRIKDVYVDSSYSVDSADSE
ncbi:MAG: tRNA guanosine(34) transglycosylase Tgt [Proteobacteria bacterium]|nr:tRNA guanosine(34) transglycosylase Tgt [Pseudomonadota bacterium]